MQPDEPRVEVIAHRGASAYAAEHTFAAYDLALAQGADRLELDVRATADGQMVVLHDATLLRTAGDPREIDRVPLAAVTALDPARRPPTLDSVLDRYGSSTRWLVELKGPAQPWHLQVAEALAARGLLDRALVQSFDVLSLRRLRRQAPGLSVGPLFWRAPGAARLRSVARFATAVAVRHTAVDTGLLRRAHGCGLGVRAWTANAPADVQRLLALGVDGVITDVPDVVRALADAPTALPAAA